MTTTELVKAEESLKIMTPIVMDVSERARVLSVIKDHQSFMEADGFLSELKRVQKRLDEERKKFTQPLDIAKKQIMDVYNPKMKILSEAEMILKGSTRKWFISEQDRKRKEEQKRIEEDHKRQEQENIDNAIVLESQGQINKSEETLNKSIVDSKPKVATSFDEGKSYGRKVWKCEVVDLRKFLEGIIDGKINPEFVEIKINALNRFAQTFKGDIKFPGIKVTEDVVMGVRS